MVCAVYVHMYDNVCQLYVHLLLQMAAPKHWIAFDGNVTQMDTPDTIRAQQLRDIYQSINREELNPTERLDVLLTLKQTVKVITSS